MPEFVDASGVENPLEFLDEWRQRPTAQSGELIEEVEFQSLLPDDPLVKYDLAKRRVVVNSNHPFVLEYGGTHDQQLVLRDTALVDLLTELFMVDVGVHEQTRRDVSQHRDQMLRLLAQVRRDSVAGGKAPP